MTIIIIIGAVLVLIIAAVGISNSNARSSIAKNMGSKVKDFKESKKFTSSDDKAYFGIDEDNGKILFARISSEGLYKKMFENFKVSTSLEDRDNGSFIAIDNNNDKIAYAYINRLEEKTPQCGLIENFHCDKSFVHKIGTQSIRAYGNVFYAIDKSQEKLLIGNTKSGYNVIPFRNIIKFEIIEDGIKTAEKSLSGVIGRSAVGGFIAGDAGAIIGGATSAAKEKKKIKEISIKILLRNENKDSVSVTIYKHISANDTNDIEVKTALETRTVLADALSIIIDEVMQGEKSDKMSQTSRESLTDELSKLVALKNAGAINDEEFSAAKSKLLS